MPDTFSLKGDTDKIASEVQDFLNSVAKYGGKDITVKNGGGFRTAPDEANIVYRNWTGALKRGAVFETGSLSVANRQKLDEFYVKAEESKEAAAEKAKAKKAFLELAIKIPSYHKLGKAVDLVDNMSAPMKKVLEKYMKRVVEPGCYHIQWKGALPDEDTVKNELGVEDEAGENKK
jgi:hypothetical protein